MEKPVDDVYESPRATYSLYVGDVAAPAGARVSAAMAAPPHVNRVMRGRKVFMIFVSFWSPLGE
jgi:hypothetical protein